MRKNFVCPIDPPKLDGLSRNCPAPKRVSLAYEAQEHRRSTAKILSREQFSCLDSPASLLILF